MMINVLRRKCWSGRHKIFHPNAFSKETGSAQNNHPQEIEEGSKDWNRTLRNQIEKKD